MNGHNCRKLSILTSCDKNAYSYKLGPCQGKKQTIKCNQTLMPIKKPHLTKHAYTTPSS